MAENMANLAGSACTARGAQMSSETGWCTIESEPAVFAELISKMGAHGLDVEELYTLDQKALPADTKVLGLIFLFKWEPTVDGRPCLDDTTTVFFARQVSRSAAVLRPMAARL